MDEGYSMLRLAEAEAAQSPSVSSVSLQRRGGTGRPGQSGSVMERGIST